MPAANVRSIEELKLFRNELVVLREKIRVAVQSADGEVGRTEDWLRDEHPAHLMKVGKKLQRKFEDAQETLRRKRLSPTPTGEPPPTTVEQKMVRDAKRRIEHVKEKLEVTKKWQRNFGREANTYRAGTQYARRWAESGLPQAIAELDRLIAHLEKYKNVVVPVTEAPTDEQHENQERVSRPADDQ